VTIPAPRARALRARAVSARALLVIAALVAALVAALPAPAHAAPSAVSVEVRLAELVNAARTQHGVRALRIDVRLVHTSRTWSRHMADHNRLAHDPNLRHGVPAGATAWAENVGYTTNTSDPAADLHRMFMNSAGHRRNVLDGRFTDLGIGVVQSGGRTWVTQRFTAGAPARVAPAVTGLLPLATSLFNGGQASHAVIVRDDVFADALAAGPLAGAGGPILLSPPGPALHPSVRRTLEQTVPRGRRVWLVGGRGAVSSGVEQELRGAGWDVRRISGSNRLLTAEAVARQVVARDGRPSRALVTTAWDWPDAVAAGAYGARSRAPVLLAERTRVPAETARAIDDFNPPGVAALGGSSAMDDGVVHELGADRVAGSTRQGTSSEAARHLWGVRDASAPRWIAAPAFGDDAWTWALGAAPLAARTGAPVLLVGPQLSGETRDYIAGLGYGNGRSATLQLVGPVPSSGADELRALLQ
jgi:uncharacterized protein YkwD